MLESPHIQELKTWPKWFQDVFDGKKPFELRFNDRNYQVGDILYLREWDPNTQEYTGRHIYRLVTYMMDSSHEAIVPGWVVLGIKNLPSEDVAQLERHNGL